MMCSKFHSFCDVRGGCQNRRADLDHSFSSEPVGRSGDGDRRDGQAVLIEDQRSDLVDLFFKFLLAKDKSTFVDMAQVLKKHFLAWYYVDSNLFHMKNSTEQKCCQGIDK